MYDYACIDLIPAAVFSAAIPPAQAPPVVTPSPTVVPAQPTTVVTTPSTEDTSGAPSAEPSTLPTAAPATPVPTSPPSPWYKAIVTPPYLFVVIAIIITAVVWRLRLLLPPRCPKCSKKEPHVHSLTITGPADASIAIAGRATLFSAEVEPPQLAAKIRWSIATQSGTSQTLGNGRNFSYVFGATGVEQVLAHLDDDGLTCGVVVYVFKTPAGGSTLADLLRSEPPPTPRSVAALEHWARSASKLVSGDKV